MAGQERTREGPTISVIIPTLGRWAMLEKAVRGARAQSGVAVQVVVAVDGADGAEIDRVGFLEHDDVVVVPLPQRRGAAAARNAALAAAEGEWVALLDDDDQWAPEKLAHLVAPARAADWAYASAMLVDPALRPLEVHSAPPPGELASAMLDHNPIPACASNLIVRTGLAREIGFDPELKHFADWDFAVNLIATGARGARCEPVLVAYVQHPGAMHVADLAGVEREFEHLRRRHRERGRELGGVTMTRWIAAGHRLHGRRARAAAAYLRGAVRYRSAADAARAGGVLLGERAMRAARRRKPAAPAAPDWLAGYA